MFHSNSLMEKVRQYLSKSHLFKSLQWMVIAYKLSVYNQFLKLQVLSLEIKNLSLLNMFDSLQELMKDFEPLYEYMRVLIQLKNGCRMQFGCFGQCR